MGVSAKRSAPGSGALLFIINPLRSGFWPNSQLNGQPVKEAASGQRPLTIAHIYDSCLQL
jgi:hypothetical protein